VKALTYHGKRSIQYEAVDDPAIEQPTDAVVKVSLAGICGSDLHVYHEREKGLDKGTVMGHEFTGEIVEIGRGVRRFTKGETVLSPFTTSCGECFFCRMGLTCRCTSGQLYGWVENGIGLQGAQAEYVRVPLADSTLHAVPHGMADEEALLLGDVFPTGYYCADMAGIEREGVYAVMGCGPVGLMAIVSARLLGAERIYAFDSVDYRLELARSFGAIPVNYTETDPLDIVMDATKGRGVDAVMEAVGSPDAQRTAIGLVRPGGTVSVVGVHTAPSFAFSPVEAYDKNLTYKTGRCPARHYMDRLIPLIHRGRLELKSVVSHRLPLEQGERGYGIFDEKLERCTKVVLETES
jgi:threonine dehydrogenase-like Zn-dependent dehydrogenase